MENKPSLSLVLESSWTKNISSIITKNVLLRQFNIIMDGNNIFRVTQDIVGQKPPYFFFYGPDMTLLEASGDIDYFISLLLNYNEEKIAEQQNLENKISSDPDPDHQVSGENYNACIKFNYDFCIGCNACIPACQYDVLTFANEKNNPPFVKQLGGDLTGNNKLNRVQLDKSGCVGCGQCIQHCPVGEVLIPTDNLAQLESLLTSRMTDLVVVLDPAAITTITEAMGCSGYMQYQIISTLKDLGFKKVFDLRWACDSISRLEAETMITSQNLMISSSCPAASRMIKTNPVYKEFAQYISNVKTPHQCMAIAVRQWAALAGVGIKIVNITNCLSNRFEQNSDINITIYELRKLFLKRGVTFAPDREEIMQGEKDIHGQFDQPFNEISPQSYQYSYSGGQSMALAQALCENKGERLLILKDQNQRIQVDIDDHVKSFITLFSFECRGEKYTMCQANGGKALQKALQMIKQKQIICSYLELMGCDGGCVCGGGMSKRSGNTQKRIDTIEQQMKLQADKSSVWKYNIANQLEYLGMGPEEFLKLFLKEETKLGSKK